MMSLLHCLTFFRSLESYIRQAGLSAVHHAVEMVPSACVWWHLPVTSALRRQRWEDPVFKVSLRYTARTRFPK